MAATTLNTDLSNIIIIDCLPVVPEDKYKKLYDVVEKLINKICACQRFVLCQDAETKGTLGYGFAEYENPADADRAIQKLNKTKLDKQHILKVCLFTDWTKFKDTPEEFVESDVSEEYVDEKLYSHLLDEGAREQYMIRYGDDTEVWWNDPIVIGKQVLEQRRKNWTDFHARWSPLGTYLVTFHTQGIRMHGGPDWKNLGKFPHSGVQLIDFSPKEKFLVTWFNNLTLWDVKTQKKLKAFPGGPTQEHGWPVFKWSFDERYFARITEDNITIHDSTTMKLVQPDPKKPTTLYLPHVKAFEWSPSANILSYWIPEMGDQPARVALVRLKEDKEGNVSFEQVTQKNLFRVMDIRMHWQSAGDFLCVKVDRFSKSSKSKEKLTSFELFRMKSHTKSIAVDVVELTEEVIAFAWEPNGMKFAVIHGDNPSRHTVSFYTMGGAEEGKVVCLKSLPKKQANHLFWSPKGTHICLAGLKSFNGILEFWNVNELELTGGGEHFMCTDLEWDPSGRYMATSVSYYRHQMENGFIIWSFQGRQILNLSRDKFLQFMWRPRPPTLLPPKRLAIIAKNLNSRAAKYQREEREFERAEQNAINNQRRDKTNEFMKFVKERKEDMKSLTEKRRALRAKTAGWNSDDESCYRVVDDYVEEIISIEEEEMS